MTDTVDRSHSTPPTAEERKLRLLFDGARDAIFWANAQTGILVDCNREAETLVGRDRSDIIGSHQSILHPPELAEEYRARFAREARKKSTDPLEGFAAHSDGHRVPIEISTSVIDVDGVPIIQGIFRDITARREEEARYRALFQNMRLGFSLHEIICDDSGTPIDYRFLDINPAFEQLTGLKAGDLVGRTVLEVLPDTEPYWIERFGSVALTGEPAQFEDYSVEFDRYFEVKVYRPAPGQFAVLSSDVSERRRAEEAIRASEERLRVAQEAASVGTWEWDIHTGAHDWSENLWALYGLDPAIHEASRESLLESIAPQDREQFASTMQEALETGGAPEVEWRVNTHDGSERWLLSRACPVLDASGTPIKYIGAVIDVTGNRMLRNRMNWTRRKVDKAHRVARIGVWEWEAATDTLTWSPELCEILGRNPEAGAPHPNELAAFYTPDSWQLLSGLAEATISEGSSYDVELAMVREDGETIWARAVGSPLTDVEGAVTGMHGTVHDISARKRAEEEAAQQRRWLSELASDLLKNGERERRRVAVELHDEVGQSLAAAKILAQNLAACVDTSDAADAQEDSRRLVTLIEHAIAGVRGLTNELSPPVLYELGLGPALSWLAESYLDRLGLECALRVDPQVVGLKGETSILLFRAARELLMNVHRHAGSSSASIDLRDHEGMAVLTVLDEGRGFDTSVSVAAAQDGQFGLFSIREEVLLLGGTLEVDSAPGRGTRVDVRIPLRAEWPADCQERDSDQDGRTAAVVP